jgi:hypothetical protein
LSEDATNTRAGFAAHHRRAERGQVDAGEPAGRVQGQHRHPEGADHALSPCAGSPSRVSRKWCWWIRPASSRPVDGWTGPWCARPGRGQATRM